MIFAEGGIVDGRPPAFEGATMKRELLCGLGGFLVGSAVTALAGYFGVYRRYIPLRQLEAEIGQLEEERHERIRQLDRIDKEYQERSKEYEEKLTEYDQRLDIYDADIESAKTELESLRASIPETEPQEDKEERMTKEIFGRYVINDPYGDGRWNGELTPREQADYDALDGDENLELGLLTEIKEERFRDTIDPNCEKYQITQDMHDQRPDFIDAHQLDYYEGDDILADGRNIVQLVGDLIPEDFVGYFGKNSMTGDPNVIICRNDVLEIDYFVERHPETYQSAVFGIDEDKAYIPEKKFNQDRAARMEE